MTENSETITGAGDIREVRAHGVANGGEAVARLDDGRVVFVRGGLPGERLAVRITHERKQSFARADVVEVLEPSTHRLERPLCPAAAHGGGCCDLAFADPEHVRDLKGIVLADLLGRIGGFDAAALEVAGVTADGAPVAVRSFGSATGWRTRTRLFVDDSGIAGVRAFHGTSVITDASCAQPDPRLALDLGTDLTPRAELMIVLGSDAERHVAQIAPVTAGSRGAGRGAGRARDRRGRAQQDRRRREAPRAVQILHGGPTVTRSVGARSWRLPVTGFWQAHRAAPAEYSRAVVEMLVEAGITGLGGATAWDLYGGAGVFAAALLDDAPSAGLGEPAAVHIVDSDGGALDAASVTFGDDARVAVHRGDVAATLDGLPRPDVVVLDPPRTGAGTKVVAAIAGADPRAVVHVGCDLGRFARDLRLFADHGYRVRSVRGFDAFPLTHHAEAIACLTR